MMQKAPALWVRVTVAGLAIMAVLGVTRAGLAQSPSVPGGSALQVWRGRRWSCPAGRAMPADLRSCSRPSRASR
ncbi:MAG: hypothetical protein R3C32_15170 [Chloroflexota bacterium]